MTNSLGDRSRVYLACRAIFTGQNAQLRKRKKIRELVDSRETSLGPLIEDFGIDRVVQILGELLDERIFQSELKAKVKFPGLFLSSPERDVQRAESEHHAAQSAAEALEEIASLDQFDDKLDQEYGSSTQRLHEPGDVTPEIPLGQRTSDSSPSLYPSYLPYTAQHVILTTAQRILEESCFGFAKCWLPSLLEDNGWDCAAAVELTKWTRILAKHSGKLPAHALAISGTPLNEIFSSTHKLRHSAVHRLPNTARGVKMLIESALRLAETLQDNLRAAQLEELHSEMDSNIKAMELNKNVLENEFAREIQEIRRQREELDKREKYLRAEMLTGDSDYKSLIGSLLEESVRRIFNEEVESHSTLREDEDRLEVQKDMEINGNQESLTEEST